MRTSRLAKNLRPYFREQVEDITRNGISSSGAGSLTVQETDGLPNAGSVRTIIVDAGSLTENSAGNITLNFLAALDKEAMFDKILTDVDGNILVDASGNVLMEDDL